MKPAEPVTRIFMRTILSVDNAAAIQAAERCSTPSWADGAEEAEDVDDGFLDDQVAVLVVAGTQEDEVGLLQGRLQGHEARVLDVRIGAEDAAAFQGEDLAELVGQRVAGIVAVALERHAEDRRRRPRQARTVALTDSTRKLGSPSLTIIAAWPITKALWLNAASCIVSFSRQGPPANPAEGKLAMRG